MATGAYDTNGIWQYGEDDNIALFSDLLNLGTESTSDAFTDDRARIATLEAGSLAGIIPVAPATVVVSSGTASANAIGTVTFSGVSTVSLNGVFNATYQNYKVIITVDSVTATSQLVWRYRVAGVDATAASYQQAAETVRINNSSALQGTTGNSVAQILDMFISDTHDYSGAVEIYKPAVAVKTTATAIATQSDTTARGYKVSGVFHGVATAYDGITFIATAGLMTGKVQVYGYND